MFALKKNADSNSSLQQQQQQILYLLRHNSVQEFIAWYYLYNYMGGCTEYMYLQSQIQIQYFINVTPHVIHNHYNIYIALNRSVIDKIQVPFYKELWETI